MEPQFRRMARKKNRKIYQHFKRIEISSQREKDRKRPQFWRIEIWSHSCGEKIRTGKIPAKVLKKGKIQTHF